MDRHDVVLHRKKREDLNYSSYQYDSKAKSRVYAPAIHLGHDIGRSVLLAVLPLSSKQKYGVVYREPEVCFDKDRFQTKSLLTRMISLVSIDVRTWAMARGCS